MNKIILASGSPRRRELLTELGIVFDVYTSDVEELHDASLPLRELCEYNAMLKAQDVAERYKGQLVLGADTLVYKDNSPLGKPKSEEEAKQTLLSLSGSFHTVCTGLCLTDGIRKKRFSEVTKVQFKSFDLSVINEYMSLVNVMDKAGSYAIQEHGEMLVESIIGDKSNVVGLPQSLVDREIRNF